MVNFFYKQFLVVQKRLKGLGGSQRQLNPENLRIGRGLAQIERARCGVLRGVVSELIDERSLEITPPIMVHPASQRVQPSIVKEIDISVTSPTKISEVSSRQGLPSWDSAQ